jgi:hypothetical protein
MAALRKPSPTNVRPIGDFCNKICQKRPKCGARNYSTAYSADTAMPSEYRCSLDVDHKIEFEMNFRRLTRSLRGRASRLRYSISIRVPIAPFKSRLRWKLAS